MSQPDPKVRQWRDDMHRLAIEVTALFLYRQVYRRMRNTAADHGDLLPLGFLHYLTDTYGISQMLAIRRQADERKDVISLNRVLRGIVREPKRLTRERFINLHEGPDAQARATASWELFAGEVGDYVDPRLVKKDLRDLHSAADRAKRWADSRVAHYGRERPEDGPPTFAELDVAIDTIGALFHRYLVLLDGEAPVPEEALQALIRAADNE